ncbi:hypothetical protein D3C71_1350600 [compost metagenome]
MAGSGGVVAQRLGRPTTDEDRPGGGDLLDQTFRLLGLDRQVLGTIEVGHFTSLSHVGHADGAGLGQRGVGDRRAGQGLHLTFNLGDDLVQGGAAVGHQQNLGVGVVLGLAQQVGGDDLEVGVAVGDDQQFRRSRRHVLRRTVRQAGRIALGLGHIGVAGPEQLIDGFDHARLQLDAER